MELSNNWNKQEYFFISNVVSMALMHFELWPFQLRNQQPSILHSTYLYDNQTTQNFWKLHSKFRVTRWHQQSLLKVNRFFFSPMLFQNFNTHTQTHQKFKRKFRMKPTVMTFLKKFSYIIYNAYKTSTWKFIFVRGELHSIFFIGLN